MSVYAWYWILYVWWLLVHSDGNPAHIFYHLFHLFLRMRKMAMV